MNRKSLVALAVSKALATSGSMILTESSMTGPSGFEPIDAPRAFRSNNRPAIQSSSGRPVPPAVYQGGFRHPFFGSGLAQQARHFLLLKSPVAAEQAI